MSNTSFDGVAKEITVNPGIATITVKDDIYSAWKKWVLLEDNLNFLPAVRTVGGESIGGSLLTGDLYFLMNGWRVVVNHRVKVDGALFHDDGIDPFDVGPGGGVISTVSQLVQTVQVASGGSGSGPTSEEIAIAVEARLQPILSLIDEPVSSRSSSSEVSTGFSTIIALLGLLDDKITTVYDGVTTIEVDVTQMLTLVDTLRKFNFNRSKIDPSAKTLTVYDDDSTTPLVVFGLLNTAQAPSIDEVAEKVPL